MEFITVSSRHKPMEVKEENEKYEVNCFYIFY
jgi:hypothetical protein